MTTVTGFRKVTRQGSSMCIFVTTLLKGSGIKEGDTVRLTVETIVPEKEEDGRDAGSD